MQDAAAISVCQTFPSVGVISNEGGEKFMHPGYSKEESFAPVGVISTIEGGLTLNESTNCFLCESRYWDRLVCHWSTGYVRFLVLYMPKQSIKS